MSSQTHYFLALPLPTHVRELLANWKELLEPRLPFKSWVHPQDYHITLAFIGNASFTQINAIKQEVKSLASKHSGIDLTLSGVGVFGKMESPRVFWGGVETTKQLTELFKDISLTCENCGFNLDKRAYHPHITMARKWSSEEIFNMEKIESIVYPKNNLTKFTTYQVVLYQTHLNRIPKYQPLSVFPLIKKED
jgi:RNA 2',3'-cyclic 3'-phosphodiesterase